MTSYQIKCHQCLKHQDQLLHNMHLRIRLFHHEARKINSKWAKDEIDHFKHRLIHFSFHIPFIHPGFPIEDYIIFYPEYVLLSSYCYKLCITHKLVCNIIEALFSAAIVIMQAAMVALSMYNVIQSRILFFK